MSIYKDWPTYSGGTDRPGQLCYNFSILNGLAEMIIFPTQIPGSDCQNPAPLDLLHFYVGRICSVMAFSPLGNSDHVIVLISIDFFSNSKWVASSLHVLRLFLC